MGSGLRALKIAVIVMAVLIVTGTTALIIEVILRTTGPERTLAVGSPAPFSTTLQEPAGTRIVGVSETQDRVAVQLQGGGADRVVLMDSRSGAVIGRISLAQ
jgi:hypothetical protein